MRAWEAAGRLWKVGSCSSGSLASAIAVDPEQPEPLRSHVEVEAEASVLPVSQARARQADPAAVLASLPLARSQQAGS